MRVVAARLRTFWQGLVVFGGFLALPVAAVVLCLTLFDVVRPTVEESLDGLARQACAQPDVPREELVGKLTDPGIELIQLVQRRHRGDDARCAEGVWYSIDCTCASVKEALQDAHPGDVRRYLRDQLWFVSRFAFAGAAMFTLLPFVFMALGRAREAVALRSFDTASVTDAFVRALLAFICTYMWMYVFHPWGEQATLVLEMLRQADPAQPYSTPYVLSFAVSPQRHLGAAFLGWYTHTLMLVFHRYYYGDTRGSRIWAALFRRLFLVMGLGAVFSVGAPTTGSEGHQELILLFLIGATPTRALLWVRELVAKNSAAFRENTWPIAALPGISSWHLLRLEEEGIHETADLAAADRKRLLADTIFDPDLVGLWQSAAVLASIVGPEVYAVLRTYCTTADGFVAALSGPDRETFIRTLGEKCSVHNPEEIRAIILERFAHAREG